MARWVVELSVIAVIASLAGSVTPWALLRHLPRAPGHPPATAPVPPARPTEIVFDDDTHATDSVPFVPVAPGADTATSEHITARGRVPTRRTDHPPGSATAVPVAVPSRFAQGVLTRHDDRWTLDLRRLPSARAAVAGMRVQPLGGDGTDGQGYEVTATDRNGLCDALGVRPGDVLVAVNGSPTLTADEALDAYVRNRGTSAASFRFRRGTGTYTVHLDLLGRAE